MNLLRKNEFSVRDKEELIDLEQFILFDVKSFPHWSIVMSGRRIDRIIKKFFKHYIAMIQELKWPKAAKKAWGMREHYMTVKPHVIGIQEWESFEDAIKRLLKQMGE